MSNDRMDVILHYQEIHRMLEELVMATSSLIRDMSDEELLRQQAFATFAYLRSHCDRCGSALEVSDGAPVAHSMGGPQLSNMCEPCYNEMHGWSKAPS
jgi:hypothetical protein